MKPAKIYAAIMIFTLLSTAANSQAMEIKYDDVDLNGDGDGDGDGEH